MKEIKIVILSFVLLMFCTPLFAKSEGNVLIYYFENLTGSEENNDLIYAIPLCLYNQLQIANQEKNYSLIDDTAFQAYLENPELDLWESDYMRNNARKKKISRILYGFFYDEGDRIRVRGKVYYTESGLILDISENDEEFAPLFQGIEKLEVAELRNCGAIEDVKTYKVPAKLVDDKETSQSKHVFNFTGSALFPVADWKELYNFGFYGNISYILFPKRNRVRIGFGPELGFVMMGSGKDEAYIDSTLLIVPFGGSFQYVIIGKNLKDRLIVSFSAGLSLSILSINQAKEESLDLYTKGALTFVVSLAKRNELSFSAGLFSVSYSDTPLNAVYGEIGFRYFIF
jgi:hypothetical protein